ncbi:hypothetical protein [Amycolatopsis benzoatilytica]|uniref:hypothetical protein n=1 Tax=Amycolatopsis benzoatilytica TaxID=346045 RepID=UPI0003798B8C|nr:hypothetical protein [Amycolatopsis benzoatilytica]
MSASARDDVPTKQEIEQMLADPSLAKTQAGTDLAWKYLEYIDDHDPTQYGFRDQHEFEQWRDNVKRDMAMSGERPTDIPLGESAVKKAYSQAKDIYDKSQTDGRAKGKKDAEDAKAKLDEQAAKASKTDAGAGTSDEILDLGLPGMRSTFDVFIPLYNRAAQAVGFQPVNKDDIYKLYDEQRKIPFTKFMAGADEFAKLAGAVTDASTDVAGQLSVHLADWHGAAADQANNFEKNYTADTKVVADANTHASDAMKAACGSIGKACRDKADWVIKYRVDSIGQVTAQDLDRIIRIVELRSNASQDDFKHCAKFLDAESQKMINDDDCNLNDDTVNHIVDQCTEYLRNNFGKFYEGYIRDFKAMCTNTHTTVDGAWKALTDFFGQLPQDPYSNVDQTAPDSGTGKSDSGGGKQSGPGSTGGTGPGTGGSGPGTGGGGGSVTPASVEMPKVPTTPSETQPATPSGAETNPVTHQPLEVDPATGKPFPIDPTTGQAVKPHEPESMTVEQGKHKISMTEPAATGEMAITVDDGTGHPKSYQLDFDKDGLPATPGQGFTQPGVPGAHTPVPGDASGDHGGAGQPASGHGTPEQGTTPGPGTPGHPGGGAGAPGQPGDAAAAHKYEPGADGKIHVEDGNLKITAERPQGPGGPTVVTVDDGSGEPVKYTLGGETKPDGVSPGHDGAQQAVGDGGTPPNAGARPVDGLTAQQAAEHPGIGTHGQPDAGAAPAAHSGQSEPVSAPGGHSGQPVAQEVQHDAPAASAAHPTAGAPLAADAGAGGASVPEVDDSTTAQSIANPMDSSGGLGTGHDDPNNQVLHASIGSDGPQPSTAELGTAPTHSDQQPQQQGMMGGGMMGGGSLGSAPGGQDQERSSAYRVTGGLFEKSVSGQRISGSLDDDSTGR